MTPEHKTPLGESDHIPEVVFKTREGDKAVCGDHSGQWKDLATADIASGKKIIIFGLPGAFTPTCSSTHLPGYEAKYDTFKELGIDEIYCTSVNDAFVMEQWGNSLRIEKVKMLPDGNAEFAQKMGLLVQKENLGFGYRSWRYSMLVEDGIIKKIFIEPGMADNYPQDPFEVSDADTMLAYLKGSQ